MYISRWICHFSGHLVWSIKRVSRKIRFYAPGRTAMDSAQHKQSVWWASLKMGFSRRFFIVHIKRKSMWTVLMNVHIAVISGRPNAGYLYISRCGKSKAKSLDQVGESPNSVVSKCCSSHLSSSFLRNLLPIPNSAQTLLTSYEQILRNTYFLQAK